jgi:hypothetical protein
MNQIKQLLEEPHAKVLVLVGTIEQGKHLFNRLIQNASRDDVERWKGFKFFKQQQLMSNEDTGASLYIQYVYRKHQALRELTGRYYTNILYTMNLGYQLDLLWQLRCRMRSPDFKGIWSVEPLWED